MCCENMKELRSIYNNVELTNDIKINFNECDIMTIDDVEKKKNYLFLSFNFCPFCGKELY